MVLIGMTVVSATVASEKNVRNEMALSQQDPKSKMQSDEFKTYRAEQEKKIAENDKKIAELKVEKNKVKQERLSAYEDKIDELERKNNELRSRISTYRKDEEKGKWESFKKEFNHDMDELGKSLKDLFKDNVKE